MLFAGLDSRNPPSPMQYVSRNFTRDFSHLALRFGFAHGGISTSFSFARCLRIRAAPDFAVPLASLRFASFSFHTPRPAAAARTSSGRRSRFSSPRISILDNPCAANASTFAVSDAAIRYFPTPAFALRHFELTIFGAQLFQFTWWWSRQCPPSCPLRPP